MNETLLVIGSGHRHFREYALRGLAAHHRVLLVADDPVGWELPHVADHRGVDTADLDAVLAAARELAGREPIDGVLTWDEMSLTTAARVGAELGVATMPVDAAAACRDKAVQRARFRDAGVPSARFRLVGSGAEAVAAAAEIGYPVVVKPRGRAASNGVQIVRSPAELRAAVALAQGPGESATAYGTADADGLVLVEEFLVGPEISVDSWVLGGRVQPYAVGLKRTDYAPCFEEVSHVVGPVLDDATAAAVRDVVERASAALGIDRTVTHTELMLTADGPRVVEVNGRLGGDLIPWVAELATPGLSVGAVLGAVAAGRVPDPLPGPDRTVGIRFLYPKADLTFDGLDVPAELLAEPWTCEVRRVSEPGTALRLPPRQFLGRAGYVVATGADVAEVDARLARLADGITVLGDPLPDPDTRRSS